MRLSGGTEVGIDADMEFETPGLEPRATAAGERGRLPNLGNSEDPRIELARRVLTARRHRELNVVYADHLHAVEP